MGDTFIILHSPPPLMPGGYYIPRGASGGTRAGSRPTSGFIRGEPDGPAIGDIIVPPPNSLESAFHPQVSNQLSLSLQSLPKEMTHACCPGILKGGRGGSVESEAGRAAEHMAKLGARPNSLPPSLHKPAGQWRDLVFAAKIDLTAEQLQGQAETGAPSPKTKPAKWKPNVFPPPYLHHVSSSRHWSEESPGSH